MNGRGGLVVLAFFNRARGLCLGALRVESLEESREVSFGVKALDRVAADRAGVAHLEFGHQLLDAVVDQFFLDVAVRLRPVDCLPRAFHLGLERGKLPLNFRKLPLPRGDQLFALGHARLYLRNAVDAFP